MAKGKKITGTSGKDVLKGTSGNDTISGLGGNDSLYGNAGNDTLDGGTGNDLLVGGNGGDKDTYLFEKGYGADTIEGSLGDRESDPIVFELGDVLKFGKGIKPSDITLDIVAVEVEIEDWTETMWNLVLKVKGSGDSVTIRNYLTPNVLERGNIQFSDGTVWKPLDVYAKVKSDPDAAEFFTTYPSIIPGTEKNDTITGTALADYIESFGGKDLVRGLGGNDSIHAGEGNNTVEGGDGDDWIIAGDGNDLLQGGNGVDAIDGGAGNNTLIGGAGDDDLSGSGRLEGGEGNDGLSTSEASTLLGGVGDDYLFADMSDASSLLDAGDGNDRLTVYGTGNSTLIGGAGDDWLSAELGNGSLLLGGTGNDTLTAAEWHMPTTTATVLDGGSGNDYFEGRNGVQHYLFDVGSGQDVIGMYPGDLPGADMGPIEFGAGDEVKFGAGMAPTGVSLDIVPRSKPDIFYPSLLYPLKNLKISVNGTSDSLTIEGYVTDDPNSRGVLRFADGTVWDYAEVLSRVAGDPDLAALTSQTDALISAMAACEAPPAAHESTVTPTIPLVTPVLAASA